MIKIHPSFNSIDYKYDIALMKLIVRFYYYYYYFYYYYYYYYYQLETDRS